MTAEIMASRPKPSGDGRDRRGRQKERAQGIHRDLNRLRIAGQIPLALVLVAAFAVRLACLLALRSDLSIRVPLLDARYYMNLATTLAHGGGWPAGPHFMSPIYPLLLSGLFRVCPPTVESVQWGQMVLGIVTTLFVYLAARRFGEPAAVSAGLMYALCGPAIIYENQVLVESLVAFSLAGSLWLLGRQGSIGFAAAGLAGILIGIAGAGRPTYLLLVAPALVLLADSERGALWKRRSVWAVVVGFLVVVAPPSIRNWRETGRPSLVTVSGGLNLYIGNNPRATGVYSSAPGVYLENDLTGSRSASRMAGRILDAEGASRFYANRAWSFLRDHPAAAARLWLRKAGFLFGPAEVPQIESAAQLRRDHPILRILAPVGFVLLLPLGLLGIARNRSPRRVWGLAVAILLAGALTHVVFFSTGRYRAALLPVLSLLAGSGLSLLPAIARGGRRSLFRLWPLALGIVLLLVAPGIDRRKTEAWEYHQAGLRFDLMDAPRSAEQMYVRSVAADSSMGEAWHNLAADRAKQGRLAEAIADYERALRHLGENPVTLYNLGVLYGRLGMDEKALSYLDRAVAADPADPGVRVDRGVALYRLGRKDEAFSEWRRVAATSPADPSLGRTLGMLVAGGVELPPDLVGFARSR
jgi:tetratricopeptide (TPR) repeat protein